MQCEIWFYLTSLWFLVGVSLGFVCVCLMLSQHFCFLLWGVVSFSPMHLSQFHLNACGIAYLPVVEYSLSRELYPLWLLAATWIWSGSCFMPSCSHLAWNLFLSPVIFDCAWNALLYSTMLLLLHWISDFASKEYSQKKLKNVCIRTRPSKNCLSPWWPPWQPEECFRIGVWESKVMGSIPWVPHWLILWHWSSHLISLYLGFPSGDSTHVYKALWDHPMKGAM